ncbi:Charged multivesicular body protein 7 [Eumeta japonica]|uniref:Charged multivesicular body protein 7 n=1 Tax=Eumeta variegata TaxID=151549 RepID=A0A4C1XNA1_EUMVA|nr:Charged multivesicular body protein 7 [Eumeta japonica]
MGIPNIFPEGEHPTCWSDDVRMNALFAPFRLKAANPESWEMKVKFWSDMLRQWCRLKNDPVLSANDARLAFQRKGRTPACIEIVVQECLQKGDLSPVSKYLQILHQGTESWFRWGARVAFKPAALAVTTLSFFLPFKQTTDQDGLPKASIDANERFAMESAVKEQATQLLSDYPSNVERFGTIEELMANTKFTNSQRETFEILLGYLISQGQARKKGNIVKLADPGQKAAPILESDEALHRLMSSERKLTADAEKFTKEAERALEDARVAMKLGNKVAAKNHLRRKHCYLQKVASSENPLENVRHLIHTMMQSEVNAAVIDTYRNGPKIDPCGTLMWTTDPDYLMLLTSTF